MNFLTRLRERLFWWNTIRTLYPTWAKFNAALREEKRQSYLQGFADGRASKIRDQRGDHGVMRRLS
jgi:hypothetical protein